MKQRPTIPVISALVFLAVLTLITLLPGLFVTHTYFEQDSLAILTGPNGNHWLGTDELGRDLFSRMVYGARVSLGLALATTLLAAGIGVPLGLVSGWRGGLLDHLIMRTIDALYAIPDLLLIILVGILMGRSFGGMLLALTLLAWTHIARLIRGEVLRIKQLPALEAAKALGFGPSRILFFHVLPQTWGPLIVTLSFRIPAVILAESTLSFIGLGLTPPLASWGTLAHDGFQAITSYPHLIFFPSLSITLTILACQILGDNLTTRLSRRIA